MREQDPLPGRAEREDARRRRPPARNVDVRRERGLVERRAAVPKRRQRRRERTRDHGAQHTIRQRRGRPHRPLEPRRLDDQRRRAAPLHRGRGGVAAFAEFPGLLFKAWVSDDGGERWGAVYIWESAEAADQTLPSRARELIGREPDIAETFDLEATVSIASELDRLGLALGG